MQYIYGLIDPRINAFFYVGKTNDVKKRVNQHSSAVWLEQYKRTGELVGSVKDQYIILLKAQGIKFTYEVLDQTDLELYSQRLELEWVLTLMGIGHPILNEPERCFAGGLKIINSTISDMRKQIISHRRLLNKAA